METITISERIVIVGAGIAGLFTALKLAPRPVTVLTAGSLKSGGSSHWAQGGVAAAIADDDSPQLHLKDTIEAGAGLVDPEAAHVLCSEGPARLQDLVDLGVPFDRDRNGALILGREAAHSLDRIVHVKGDQAGQAIMSTLVEQASNALHIEIKERIVAEDLATDENGCVAGVYCLDVLASDRFLIPASAVVLATGGIGGLFTVTTNPKSAVGSGLAMAALVGAVLRDLEFVQFHPTALDVGSDPAPLATEALRGDGAILVNADGRRFMADYHDAEEFAPRDIVARAVEAERAAGRGALLDTRTSIGASIEEKYPGVFAAAAAAGIDAKREPLPVAPAAHYHMGGIKTDRDGQTSVEGLYAVGEVASTGVHGANRLASNSLLEALVFGARTADHLRHAEIRSCKRLDPRGAADLAFGPPDQAVMHRIRQAMATGCALIRTRKSLEAAQEEVALAVERGPATHAMGQVHTTCNALLTAAMQRCESRGGHFRADFQETDEAPRHLEVTFNDKGEFRSAFTPLSGSRRVSEKEGRKAALPPFSSERPNYSERVDTAEAPS